MEIRNVVYIALFAAITAAMGVLPPITIPSIGVPITAQTLGVMLAGGILGAKRGALSIVLFLVLVAVGLPLLSGGRGGFGVFLSPSGGFLISWILGAFVTGLIVEQFWNRLNHAYALFGAILGGVLVVYAIGIPWLAVAAELPIEKAFLGAMAFVPGDLIKAVIASVVIMVVKRSYPVISKNIIAA